MISILRMRMWSCLMAAVLTSFVEEVLSCAMVLTCPLLDNLHCVVVTLGAMAVLLCGGDPGGHVSAAVWW